MSEQRVWSTDQTDYSHAAGYNSTAWADGVTAAQHDGDDDL